MIAFIFAFSLFLALWLCWRLARPVMREASPEDAQFAEAQRLQLAEIARIYQVPLHLVGGDEQSNYALLKQEWERLHVGLRCEVVVLDEEWDLTPPL